MVETTSPHTVTPRSELTDESETSGSYKDVKDADLIVAMDEFCNANKNKKDGNAVPDCIMAALTRKGPVTDKIRKNEKNEKNEEK